MSKITEKIEIQFQKAKQFKKREVKYNEPDIVYILLMLFFFGMIALVICGVLTS